MKVSEMIDFLQSLKYDDYGGERELNEKQVIYNSKMDRISQFLSSYIERPDRENDPDCVSGACPVR